MPPWGFYKRAGFLTPWKQFTALVCSFSLWFSVKPLCLFHTRFCFSFSCAHVFLPFFCPLYFPFAFLLFFSFPFTSLSFSFLQEGKAKNLNMRPYWNILDWEGFCKQNQYPAECLEPESSAQRRNSVIVLHFYYFPHFSFCSPMLTPPPETNPTTPPRPATAQI